MKALSEQEATATRKIVQAEVGSSRAPQDPADPAEAMKAGAEAFLVSLDSIDLTLLAIIHRFRRANAIQMGVGLLMTVSLVALGYVNLVLIGMAREVNTLVREQRVAMARLTETQSQVARTEEKIARTEEKVQATKEAVQEVVDTAPKVEIDKDGKATVVVPIKQPEPPKASKKAPSKALEESPSKAVAPLMAPAATPSPASPPGSFKMPIDVEGAEAY